MEATSGRSEFRGFFEVPGILLIRLMSRCNEKCRFCMVEEEIHESDDVGLAEAYAHIERQPVETQIEFFGGEPTIYPHFLNLLRFARNRGHFCSIATNARAFQSERFTAKVAACDPSKIYIRSSLYGDTAPVHDYYTRTPASFEQTTRGIQNVAAAGFLSQVNIVIMKQNYQRLEALTRLVVQWNVPRIKFGNLISLQTCAEHAVDLSEVQRHLRSAVALAEGSGLTVTIEKTPLCVADGRLDLMSTEREIYRTFRSYDDSGACRRCLVRRWCDGVDPHYARIFGMGALRQITTIPRAAIAPKGKAPELLKGYCVEVESEELDEAALTALETLSLQVKALHGRLAIFPTRYVDHAVKSAPSAEWPEKTRGAEEPANVGTSAREHGG